MDLHQGRQDKLREVLPEILEAMKYESYVKRADAARDAVNAAALKMELKRKSIVDQGGAMTPDYFESKEKDNLELQQLIEESRKRLEEVMDIEKQVIQHLEKFDLR